MVTQKTQSLGTKFYSLKLTTVYLLNLEKHDNQIKLNTFQNVLEDHIVAVTTISSKIYGNELHCNRLLLLPFDWRRYVCLLSPMCPLLYGESSIEIHVSQTPYYFSCQECFTFSNFCINNSRNFWLELSL